MNARWRRGALLAALIAVGAASPSGAAVPGENGKIAFDRYASGSSAADIYTMKPDGSDLTNLTRRSPEDDDVQPAYSPDGKRIAWTRGDEIWMMKSNGKDKRRLVKGGSNTGAAFSPSGKKLVYTHSVNAHAYITVLKLKTGDKRRLGVEGIDPAYSPDGQFIAYQTIGGVEDDIHTVFRTGQSDLNITSAQNAPARHPDWSPDGSTIVYQRAVPAGSWDIYTMTPGGEDVTPIVQGTADQMNPVVSPDGVEILFQNRVSDTDFDIWSGTLAPGTPLQLTSDPAAYDEFPAWQPR